MFLTRRGCSSRLGAHHTRGIQGCSLCKATCFLSRTAPSIGNCHLHNFKLWHHHCAASPSDVAVQWCVLQEALSVVTGRMQRPKLKLTRNKLVVCAMSKSICAARHMVQLCRM